MDSLKSFDSACEVMGSLRIPLSKMPVSVRISAQEIRLRAEKPLTICDGRRTLFLNENGRVFSRAIPECLRVSQEEMQMIFQNLCSYSVYSHENEIRSGYITIRGGHRAGICGTAVLNNNQIVSLREISSVNLRIAREKPGCATEILSEIENLSQGLLIAGAPSSGKTTVLRDLARQLAGGMRGDYKRVAIVDERGELAGTFQGIAQNDMGICADVLNGYPKSEGILQAIRVLSPDYIFCDELGGEDDARAVESGMFAGVSIVATVHAASAEEISKRPVCRKLLETGAFGSVAVLKGRESPGKIEGIFKAGDLLENSRHDTDCGSMCIRGVNGVA